MTPEGPGLCAQVRPNSGSFRPLGDGVLCLDSQVTFDLIQLAYHSPA